MNKKFFDTIRERVFGGTLTQGVVNTLNEILIYYKSEVKEVNYRELAYILATAYHEAYSHAKNPQWLPVREGFTSTNVGAIKAVTKLYDRKIISKNYALPSPKGHSYYGRGLVQITFEYNYKKAGDKLGLDLVNNPDLTLNLDVAVKILVRGMLEGWFTGKKLKDYINSTKADYLGARRIINGVDARERIAKYAETFYDALV